MARYDLDISELGNVRLESSEALRKATLGAIAGRRLNNDINDWSIHP